MIETEIERKYPARRVGSDGGVSTDDGERELGDGSTRGEWKRLMRVEEMSFIIPADRRTTSGKGNYTIKCLAGCCRERFVLLGELPILVDDLAISVIYSARNRNLIILNSPTIIMRGVAAGVDGIEHERYVSIQPSVHNVH